MNRSRGRLLAVLWTAGIVGACGVQGCNDVGDSGAPGSHDDGGPDGTLDGSLEGGDDTGNDTGEEAATLDSPGQPAPEASGDGEVSEAGPEVESGADVGIDVAADVGRDAGADVTTDEGVDAPAEAAGEAAAEGAADAGADVGVDVQADAAPDATVDAAPDVAQEVGPDVGPDAPPDVGAPDANDGGCNLPAACNADLVANASANMNASGSVCTQTELAIFQKDPTGACLNCAFQNGVLDDTQGDTNQECEDPITHGTAAECIATLECGIGDAPTGCSSGAAPAMGTTLNAYCGAQSVSACSTGTPLGPCATTETAGFPTLTAPSQIVGAFGMTAYASGRADQILTGLHTNCATQCGM